MLFGACDHRARPAALCPRAAAAGTVSSQLQVVDGVDDVAAADAAPRTVKRKPRGKSAAKRKQRFKNDDDDDDHRLQR